MSVTATRIRSGRASQLLLAFQSAKGTIVTNFSSAAKLWTDLAEIPVGPEKSAIEDDMHTSGPRTGARFSEIDVPAGQVLAIATPESVEYLLRSNFGAFAAGAFTLAEKIAATQFLTIGWVENTASGAAEKFCRVRDAWFGRLEILLDNLGRLVLRGEYGGTVLAEPLALNALGGVTLPTAPMAPADVNPFTVRSATLVRDPAGLNVSIRIDKLRISLDQGMEHDSDDMAPGSFWIFKSGPLYADVDVEGVVSDESWAIISDARAGTKRRFRVVASASSPAKTLTMDFYEMDFKVLPLGHEGRDYQRFRAIGRAHVTGSSFVSIAMA